MTMKMILSVVHDAVNLTVKYRLKYRVECFTTSMCNININKLNLKYAKTLLFKFTMNLCHRYIRVVGGASLFHTAIDRAPD